MAMVHWVVWVDPNIFPMIIDHEYYQRFEKIRYRIKKNMRFLAMLQIK